MYVLKIKMNITTRITSIEKSMDTHWLIYCGTLVFLMQCGFAMLEAGCVRSKNTKNILFKNTLDACVGAMLWWFLGYGIAYDSGNAFIGGVSSSIFTYTYTTNEDVYGTTWANWFFQYVFAATAATIVSGAMAERTTIIAYLVYTSLITAFVYPVVVHWVWSSEGWLSSFNDNAILKIMDFAGSGVVHMTGGIAGFCGTFILGPRSGRFEQNFEGQSSTLQVLGTLLLWFGWYGFNCGSTLGLSPDLYARDAARVAVTTTLGAASGGITSVVIGRIMKKQYLPDKICNGILSGLVSVTAGCSVIYPWHSVVSGFIGAILYSLSSYILIKFKIDDPLDAFAVHGVCGFWGLLSVGLFAVPSYAYNNSCGAFFGCGDTLAAAFLGGIVQIIWVGTCSTIIFMALKLLGILRISKEEEDSGLDSSKHGGISVNL